MLPHVAAAVGAGAVYCHGEVTAEEQQVERAVAAALDRQGARLMATWGGGTLFHQEDLPFKIQDMPASYGGWRRGWAWEEGEGQLKGGRGGEEGQDNGRGEGREA